MDEIKNLSSHNDINARISYLRNSGELSEAIMVCQEASRKFPNDYFYPKIRGDIYFQQEDYDSAAEAFIEFLKKMPAKPRLFGDFAKRYYRLRRVWPQQKVSNYATLIMSEIRQDHFDQQTAIRGRALIKADVPKEIKFSDEGQIFIKFLVDDRYFRDLVKHAKKLKEDNSIELEAILDRYILNRDRTAKTFKIDAHTISIYERMEKYENALKIAKELLSLHLEPEIVRSAFRACRRMGSYEQVDKLLANHPEILKSDAFNVLYELIYYFEAQNDLSQVRITLNRMEKNAISSIPIQKTVRNFYIRFGLLEEADRVKDKLSELYASGRKVRRDFPDEVQESELGVGSKIKELYSDLEYQKQLTAISDLTIGISHEFGQPITNIRYTVQFYRRLFEKEIQKEAVFNVFDSILEETQRMGGLMKRLSPLTSSRNVIDRFDLMDRIQKRFRAESARLRKLKIKVNVLPSDPIYLIGDAVKCDQLINNLLLNSIDAIEMNKRSNPNQIDVRVKDRGENINIAFSDTGTGIQTKYRGKIFDPFFSTKAPGKGEGLGLFIVWNLLKSQGGKINLDSNYKNGTRFLITIPKNVNDA